ncbi:MAG TPA: Gfo/Idh/MocA family oxidoreductase [Thermomicrobiaceae bacterium]|nr:Gfo/Idh/MocA family oxidoreductase [Thermomicrobiaceae bacterium]
MTEPARIGVIGTGFGRQHVEIFQKLDHAEVVAVCSAQLERASSLAQTYGVPEATDDYSDLLRPGSGVDAVVIATPPGLHHRMALDAIAAGKHVFCEKPLAASLDEAREMCRAAEAAGVVNMINYQMRFAPNYAQAHRMAGEGYIGRLAALDLATRINPVGYLQSPAWSSSKASWFTDAGSRGGLLGSSAGPHMVDLALWYGGPVEAVAAGTAVSRKAIPLADGTEVRDISAEDTFLLIVRFAGGAVGTLRGIPIAHRSGGWSLELDGAEGSLIASDGNLLGTNSASSRPEPIDLKEPGVSMRQMIAQRFIEAIHAGGNGSSTTPSFRDGLAAQALLEAAIEAAETGRWVAPEAV